MMCAPLAHFLILEMAVSKVAGRYDAFLVKLDPPAGSTSKFLNSPITQWGYLGAAGPDLCGANDDVDWVFDLMHWKKSNVFVANWIRDMPDHGEAYKVDTAFILGYLCHMAADILFHPYVNMYAGTYDDQQIKYAAKSWIPRLGKKKEAQMHKYVELHQDAYVATRYFGAKKMNDAQFNPFFPSWRRFIKDMINGHNQFKDLVDIFYKTVQATYPVPADKTLKQDKISAAFDFYGRWFLDDVYDHAVSPVPDVPDMPFVNHPNRDRDYDTYLWAAADLTVNFWKAAMKLKDSPHSAQDRMDFFSVVRPYNLDTGFAVRVYANPWKIYIRHDHSWAECLNAPTQVFDSEIPV